MANEIREPDVDDALQYIVQFLRASKHVRRSGGYGYGVYLPFVMMAYAEGQGSTESNQEHVWAPLSVRIRVETIAHYLGKYSADIIARKKAAMPGHCPLL